MITKLLSYFAGAAIRRWILGAVIGIVVAGAGWKWHNFKEGLITKGQQVCVQEINKETVSQLQDALAAEKSARADLTAKLAAAALVNQEARERLDESETKLAQLSEEMDRQEEADEEYKKWRNADLPRGVTERLRSLGTGSDPDTVRDDSN